MAATVYPYLAFENAKEAVEYYQEVFDATEIKRIPATAEQAEFFGLPSEHLEDTTMYGSMRIGGAKIMLGDAFMAIPQPSSLVSVVLDFKKDDTQEAKQLFEMVATTESVKVTLPFADQEFGGQIGQLVDQYGITWIIRVESNAQQ